MLDIAESENPEQALEEYKKKDTGGYFDEYFVAKEGVNPVFDNDRVIVPVGREVRLIPAGFPERVSISELVVSNSL